MLPPASECCRLPGWGGDTPGRGVLSSVCRPSRGRRGDPQGHRTCWGLNNRQTGN